MSEMTNSKKGHPVLALVLGILGIAAALFTVILTGAIGACLAGVLGLAAIIIGVVSRKGGKGMGGIVTGVLAIILAVAILFAVIGMFNTLREKALQNEETALVAQALEKPYLGLVGVSLNLPQDEAAAQTFTEQLRTLMEDTAAQ